MIAIEDHDRGLVLPVRASAGARKNGIQGVHDGKLKVAVTQAPEKGKANKALAAVLAKALGLRASQVILLSGETAPHKRFLFVDVERAELERRLNQVLSGPG